MSVIEVELPDHVDPEAALVVFRGIAKSLGSGQRIAIVHLPGNTPDTAMPQIMLAASMATKVALANLGLGERSEAALQSIAAAEPR